MCLAVVSIEGGLSSWDYNRTCVTLFSTMDVVTISITAISRRSSNANANFLPLLPQFVNRPKVRGPTVNR